MQLESQGGLVIAIRSDARYATAAIRQHCIAAGKRLPVSDQFYNASLDDVIHSLYREWSRSVLTVLANHIDYERYGLSDAKLHRTKVHIYDSHHLLGETKREALSISGDRPILVSLDDMRPKCPDEVDIAFSRLFSEDGVNQYDYVARPGHAPIQDQLAALLDRAKEESAAIGRPVPIILLEDNVRYAKMLNWLFGQMEQAGIFEYAYVKGIATCFSCATQDEKNAIQHDGRIIPVMPVVDYGGMAIDVLTPRDFLFDGLVVKDGEGLGRIPMLWTDIESRLKILPGSGEEVRTQVAEISQNFIGKLEAAFQITLPVSAFAWANTMENLKGLEPSRQASGILPRPAMVMA